ncbi:MAG: hypothetical protein OXI74_05755 [Rhodospirillaceae bacterium]|nr:hypothetical protein [Rhodospirillaceae bacterium]
MHHLHKTCLYAHDSGSPMLAHHRADGTLASWIEPTPGAAAADLLHYRHLMLENPAETRAQLPGRSAATVIRHRADVWRGQTPKRMTLVAEASETELIIHHTVPSPQIRAYFGLPAPQDVPYPNEDTEVLSHLSGAIQVAKRMPDAVHFIEPEYRRPTGLSDAVSFHLNYESLDPIDQEHRAFPLDSPAPVSVVSEDAFISQAEDVRTIAVANDRTVMISLPQVGPLDRRYLGLLHACL